MTTAGVITLPDSGVVTPANAVWYRIVSRIYPTARPTEVRIDCAWPSDVIPGSTAAQYPPLMVEGLVGQRNASGSIVWEPHLAGALRIIYGKEGARRTLVCDIRSQRLYLGACDYVTVEAMRWRSTAWTQVYGNIVVGADIAFAEGGAYDEATSTSITQFLTAAAVSRSQYIPAHARAWSPLITNNVSGEVFWGGTNPDIYWGMQGGSGFVASPSTYRWMPPMARFELSGQEIWLNVSSDSIALTQTLWIGTRFYLST